MATWLITGASRGLGRALAKVVLERGHNAVLGARAVADMQELMQVYLDRALAVPLDVTDVGQIRAGVQAGVDRFGQIDVLINNAGYGYRAAVEEGEQDQIEQLFATNVYGPVNMIKAVLPGMRQRRAGAIVNVSSIGARGRAPGSGYYSASKAALEGISGALHEELSPLGISVTVVEPGPFRTDFAGSSIRVSGVEIGDYAQTAGARRERLEGHQPGDPVKAAGVIIDAVEAEQTPDFLLLGPDAVTRYDSITARQMQTVDRWRERSMSTDLDDA